MNREREDPMKQNNRKPLFLLDGRQITAGDIAALFEALTGRQPDPAEMRKVAEMLAAAKFAQERSGR